jgi:carbon monoxide dehydrogenase subunit G
MHACERVGLDFFDRAPVVFTNSVELAITPEQVFEVLEDADAWPRWASVITRVDWTSPKPYGVGTTRTVRMRGGIVGDEEFLAWEPYRYVAFRFNTCSTRAVAAFAEQYTVEPTPGGCRLTWTLAQQARGPAALVMRAVTPVMNRTFAGYLKNLRRYTDERF